jgi:predicted CopG family antitoxin
MEDKKPLIPRKIVNSEGLVYYDEKSRAWGIVRLKSDVIREFYQLQEKFSKFSYKLVYYRTYEELEKAVKEMKKTNDLPILLNIYKEGNKVN